MDDPDIWTATRPDGPSRIAYILLGAGFAALVTVAVCCTVLWQTDAIPWTR